ncbi:hypothetical protein FOZ63_006724, partial [Perkinsus olseni]
MSSNVPKGVCTTSENDDTAGDAAMQRGGEIPPCGPNELEFKISDFEKYKFQQHIRSPSLTTGPFTFKLLVFPRGDTRRVPRYLTAYVEWQGRKDLVYSRQFAGVKCQISVINQKDFSESFVMSGVHKFCEKDRGMGWDLLTVPEILNPAEGWLDEGGNLVLRATVTLPNGQVAMQEKAPVLSVSRAQIVGKDPTPLSPEWHEVAVYPGGIRSEDGQRSLAAYIHLLRVRAGPATTPVKLKMRLLNHKDPERTIAWTSVHTFDEIGQSWGCPALLHIKELTAADLGWLDAKGEV